MRLLSGIAGLTVVCMFAIAVVTDRLADISFANGEFSPTSHIHLINDVDRALQRAKDCRAAYLVTGNASYLDQYRAACTDVDSSMDRLVNEDQEVTVKLAHAQGLRQFVHEKLTEIGRVLESRPAATAGMPTADTDLARIQKLLGSLAQEESRDVSGELDAAHAQSIFHQNVAIALAIINVLFLGGVTFCAIQIQKLHALITMCAWSRRVQYQGQWVPLEEYLRKRFGIRISHGISKEEYDKWSQPGTGGEPATQNPIAPGSIPAPAKNEAPQAAA